MPMGYLDGSQSHHRGGMMIVQKLHFAVREMKLIHEAY